MSQRASVPAFVTCVFIAAIGLTGCSVGALPGGLTFPSSGTTTLPEPVPTGAPSEPKASVVPSSNALVAVPRDCPTPRFLSTFFPYPLTVQGDNLTAKGALNCNYSSGTVKNVLAIVFRPDIGSTVADLKAEIDQADTDPSDSKGPVTGIGKAAYYYSDGEESGMLVLNGQVVFSVVDGYDLASIEKVARGVLAG